MALYKIENDISNDLKHFADLYKMTCEEFINKYTDKYKEDNGVINLTGKIIVSLRADSDKNLPFDLLSVFIPEEEKKYYKASLIYAGHISFIKLEYIYEDGKVSYLYKDDECPPMNWEEFMEYEGDVVYCCKEKGFSVDDIKSQIEMFISSMHDYNYRFNEKDIIILEGL